MRKPSKTDVTVKPAEQRKCQELEPNRESPTGSYLTTDHGLRIPDTDNSLKAGPRGPTLLEDFHLREKLTRFDHERIPERVVHARGFAAHGHFQVYESMSEYTRAKFLKDPAVKTPVFVRFSTVNGSRGSADTVRDARGFATRFYTEEGNFDLVGNNIPVFFIQDAIKFPDLVHAFKPEPHSEIPQAATAHDNFWDFASLVPETTHMLLWILSDRGIPRSFRMMEGFGVHTFRLVNEAGKARLVKFHWKPLLGVHSLVWDEAQKLAGKDPDFHRRDLWESIERGDYPEWELAVQLIEEEDQAKFDFDLLDATKLVPEELVPARRIGKLTLTRNVDNFFAETEQVAFCVANLVPGIDVTDDPLLQGRLFSYQDTQLLRLGGPNFVQLPINRPVAPVQNNQQDGFHQHRIPTGRTNYFPNSLGGGCPMLAPQNLGGYVHHPEKVSGPKLRTRSPTLHDHFSQARLFWNSMSEAEKGHIVLAARFELSLVESHEVRQRTVDLFANVNPELAAQVAAGIGVTPAGPAAKDKVTSPSSVARSPALSMENTVKTSVKTRKVAILIADGYSGAELSPVLTALHNAGALPELIAKNLGPVRGAEGDLVQADRSHLSTASVFYDAVLVPGGLASGEAMRLQGAVIHFLNEAFRHGKPIAALGEGVDLLQASEIKGVALADPGATGSLVSDRGVVTLRNAQERPAFIKEFLAAIAQHRFWDREQRDQVPA